MIPMPCVSVISRVAGPEAGWAVYSQEVGVIPTSSSSFPNAVEALMGAYRRVVRAVGDSKLSVVPSSSAGCPKLRASLTEIIKVSISHFRIKHQN